MSNWLESAYRAHRQQLFRVAWLILRDQGRAEDAVHAAFTRLMRSKQVPKNEKAYLLSAVRNAAIDEKRRCEREESFLTEPSLSPNRMTVTPYGAFDDELAELPEVKREVIELRLRVGLSFREIAELLNESLSTVSSRYQRAIEELQQLNGVSDERD